MIQVTDEMVKAYLDTNNAYWAEVDIILPKHPSKWTRGTPSEATKAGLEAVFKLVEKSNGRDSSCST